MCRVHVYRASCGHLAPLETASSERGSTIFCEKNPPCKKPTYEVASLLSRCAECHAKAAAVSAIPNMHRVDVSKFKNLRKSKAIPTITSKKFSDNLDEPNFGLGAKFWRKLRGDKNGSIRARSRQPIQSSQYPRYNNSSSLAFCDNTWSTSGYQSNGFYDLI
ncbi:hypothetical protein Dda_3712 [Drechslerella dactyloides]|uniref:Uncharacterized protein n=1 Tax=Drechslerella dactyloides TaxID=74499 RepID=A0AAD6IZ96_DREDA|nr:hypothetical protein Dda_3712 [Drechslerella dactyloides]